MRTRYAIIGTVLILSCWFFFQYGKKVNEKFSIFFSTDNGISNNLGTEYLGLFSVTDQRHFSNMYSHSSKVRNSFGIVDYDSLYTIIIYKIPFAGSSSIDSVIQVTDGIVQGSINIVYAVVNQNTFKLEYKSGGVKPISKILLTFDEKNAKSIFKNDSILYYYLPKGEFSVKNGVDSAVDFYVEPKGPFGFQDKLPKYLLFLKRNDALFFFMMFPIEENATIPVDLLYSIVIQKK